jgi:TolB-like protein/pimeloyl-ACP methyl ester carboxylesterase/tetratricopeptide (TPR) repeat protein
VNFGKAMGGAETFVFGEFRLLAGRRELLVRGAPAHLGSRAFDLLLALVRRHGQLATKDELMAEVWPDTVVEDNNLKVQISAIRKLLGKEPGCASWLMTVPGRGYRFVAPLEREMRPATSDERPLPKVTAEPAAPLPLPDRPSIAVLPFTNMSGEPEEDYFADGIVEDIITALSRFPSVFVIARHSSFTYKGRAVDIRQVGRELGVRYVLEGSVRKAGGRVRVTGQLVEAEAANHVWADRYECEFGDIFALQDEMTANMVGALVPSLERAEMQRARSRPPQSLDAYDLYLRAMAAFHTWTKQGTDEALRLLDQALTLDPNFVSAVLLAENCWARRHMQGWAPQEEALRQSARLARLAVETDPENAEALAVLAHRTPAINQDYEEAIALAERAVAMNPNSTFVWGQSGWGLVYAARPEQALLHFQRALRLNPRDVRALNYLYLNGMALALIQLERDAEAVATARKAVRQRPNGAGPLRALAAGLALAGQLDEARVTLGRVLKLDPTCSLESILRYGYSEMARARYFEGLRRAGMPNGKPDETSVAKLMPPQPANVEAVETATARLPRGQQVSKGGREQRISFCRTADGVSLAVARVGRGMPLVCTPTWGTHLEYDWENPIRAKLWEFLADRFELIRYDGRGFGLSDRNVAEISFATLQTDLQAIVDALDLRRYAVFCASTGCPAAIAHAASYPEDVAKMIIHAGIVQGANKWWSAEAIKLVKGYVAFMGNEWGSVALGLIRSIIAESFPGLSPEQVKWCANVLPITTSPETALRYFSVFTDIDVTDRLAKVHARTLVLHCRASRSPPFEHGLRIATSMPNARLVGLESDNEMPLPGEPAWPVFLGAIEALLLGA